MYTCLWRCCGGVARLYSPFSCLPYLLGMPRDHISVEGVDVSITTPIVEAKKDVSPLNKIERLSHSGVLSII